MTSSEDATPPNYNPIGSIYIVQPTDASNLFKTTTSAYGAHLYNQAGEVGETSDLETDSSASGVSQREENVAAFSTGETLIDLNVIGTLTDAVDNISNRLVAYRVDTFVLDSDPNIRAIQVYQYQDVADEEGNLQYVPRLLSQEAAVQLLNSKTFNATNSVNK
ncbi:MAG: hypothetical protein ISP90_12725 [Nevskia sp.]|nr:hypothetical protein [Nevskia sp.]